MAGKIKGITIELDGNTQPLQKALADVDKKTRSLTTELRQVDRALKFNPGNVELIAQKQQILKEAIEATTQRLNRLKAAQEQVVSQFKSGQIGVQQYRAFQREIIQTESKLKGLKAQIDKLDDSKAPQNLKKDLDGVQKEAVEAEGAISDLSGAIAGLAASEGVASAIEKALDTSSLNTKIEIAFDVPPASIQSVKNAIKTVEAYGIDAEEALEGVRRQWALNKNASDATNTAIVKGAAMISRAYADIDFKELIQETNEVAKELKISQNEALGLINALLKVGFPPEQLDIISEYGQQLQRAGFDAKEIQAIFAAGIETGTWNIDNLLDGLKEGRIRLAEFGQEVPKSVKELIKDTSISEKQLQSWGQAIAKGGEGGRKAMVEVAKALNRVEDQTLKNALGVAFFGTMYEDQGQNIIDTLINAEKKTVDLKQNQDQLNESIQKMESDPAVKWAKAMSDLKSAMAPVLSAIADVVSKVAEWISENPKLTATITGIITAIGTLMGFLAALGPVWSAVVAGAKVLGTIFGAVAGVISAKVALIVAAIAGLIALGVLLYKNWDTVVEYLKTAWDSIVSAAVSTWTYLTDFFAGIWDGVSSAAMSVWTAISSFLSTVWGGILTTATTIWNGLKAFFMPFWESVKVVFQAAWAAIKVIFSAALLTIYYLVTGQWDQIGQVFQKAKEKLQQIVKSLWDRIKSIWTTVINNIRTITSNVINAIVNFFSQLPGRVMTYITNLRSRAVSAFNQLKTSVTNAARSLITSVVNFFQQLPGRVVSTVNTLRSRLVSAWNSIRSSAVSAGKNIIQGMINGVSSMAKSLVSKATSVVKSAVNAAKKVLGIKSPSRVFMDIGRDTGRGLEIGLEKQISAIAKKAAQLADAVIFDLPAINVTSQIGQAGRDQLAPQNNVTYTVNVYPQQANITAQQIMRELDRTIRANGGRV